MSEPLKYKVEKALTSYLGTLAGLDAFTKYEGQNPLAQAPPCITVHAMSQTQAFENARPKNITVIIEMVSRIDDDDDSDGVFGENADRSANWTTHRTALSVLELGMEGLTTIKAHVNKANVVDRPVSDFYLYDLNDTGQSNTFAGEDRVLISVLEYTALAENQDN